MRDITKKQSVFLLGSLALILIVVDSQCYNYYDVCLPDLGMVQTADKTTISDQYLLMKSFDHGEINKEWKEKLGAIYTLLGSKALTGNYHTFPIISSIALLITTFFFTLKISGNRLSGIIAVMVLEFSKTFMWYSDSLAYPNFFMVFLMLSIYPFQKKILKPLAFIVSFVMKAEALAFLPLTLWKEKDNRIRIGYIGIAIAIGGIALALNWVRFGGSLNIQNIIYPQIGLYLLDQDMWILSALTPVVLLLFYLRRQKVEWSSFLLGSMGYCLLFQYVLPIVSSYGAFGYRMLPFVVFFAMSVGLIISKKDLLIEKLKQSKEPKIL